MRPALAIAFAWFGLTAPALAQGGPALAPLEPPPASGELGAVPPPPGPDAPPPDAPASYGPATYGPASYGPANHGPATVDPRITARQAKRAHALELQTERLQRRIDRPWRYRVSLVATGSPRSMNGFGPYEDAERWVYPGVLVSVGINRWLGRWVRLELEGTVGKVFGDTYSRGDHGAEGSVGAGIGIHSSGRTRIGLGLGGALVGARELDEAASGHFGWLGARLQLLAELAFSTRRGVGLVVRVSPTFTYAPYATGLAPGVMFSVGLEL